MIKSCQQGNTYLPKGRDILATGDNVSQTREGSRVSSDL